MRRKKENRTVININIGRLIDKVEIRVEKPEDAGARLRDIVLSELNSALRMAQANAGDAPSSERGRKTEAFFSRLNKPYHRKARPRKLRDMF